LPSTFPSDYANVFTQAAVKYNINPNYLAALFITENGNTIKDFDTDWAANSASGTGAQGPFQFEPGTWAAYEVVGGSGDTTPDVYNIWDAAFTAANYMSQNSVKASTPIGNLTTPYDPSTFTYFAASYNAGAGAVQEYTTPTSPLDAILAGGSGYEQTVVYVTNVYDLLTSGLTQGDPSYGGNNGKVVDQDTSGNSSAADSSNCQTSQGQAAIVQEALSLAWPEPYDVANPPRDPMTPTSAYSAAVQKYYPGAPFNGADCGTFVGIVMHASGADPNYPSEGTIAQQIYVENHPNLYTIVTGATSTADLQPGDILIVNSTLTEGNDGSGHTFIYVGPQAGGWNEAGASMDEYMPQLGTTPPNLQDPLHRGPYVIARLKSAND
jgi:hypothetical protein